MQTVFSGMLIDSRNWILKSVLEIESEVLWRLSMKILLIGNIGVYNTVTKKLYWIIIMYLNKIKKPGGFLNKMTITTQTHQNNNTGNKKVNNYETIKEHVQNQMKVKKV